MAGPRSHPRLVGIVTAGAHYAKMKVASHEEVNTGRLTYT